MGWDSLRKQRFEKQLELGIIDEKFPLAPRSPEVERWEDADEKKKKQFELEMALYAATIDRMDRNIGRVIKKLDDIKGSENTIIIFFSDNGGCHTTPKFAHLNGTPGGPNSFPSYGFPGSTVSNVPFRKQKQYIHEGGIATPLIAWYPSMIKASRIDSQPAHVVDIMPTLVNISNSSYPEVFNNNDILPMQGENLLPAFKGDQVKRRRPLFWEHVGNRGVRVDDWKLVAAKPDLKWELYDMEKDRTELHDLSKENPDKKEELVKLYQQWADRNQVLPWDSD
jgi:arylsulfatase